MLTYLAELGEPTPRTPLLPFRQAFRKGAAAKLKCDSFMVQRRHFYGWIIRGQEIHPIPFCFVIDFLKSFIYNICILRTFPKTPYKAI